jgi:hypothetical protein
MVFQHHLGYTVVVSFIGGGNRTTWRKPLTCRKENGLLHTNFIKINNFQSEEGAEMGRIIWTFGLTNNRGNRVYKH